MFRTTRTARTALALAACSVAAALSLPGVASASCSEMRDSTAPAFGVKLCAVSDVDQYRSYLPDSGDMYCGPSSLFNSVHYLNRQKGVPITLSPPQGNTSLATIDPLNPNHFGWTSWWINQAAVLAGGSADGTSMADNRAAFDQLTAESKPKGWAFSRGYVSTHNTPEFGLAIAEKQRNAPVQMVYGRYAKDAANTRTGGHIVTVVEISGTVGSGQVDLWVHDPARAADHNTGDYLATQSPYRLEKVTLKKTSITTGVFGGSNATHTVWELTGTNYTYGGKTRQMVEGFNWFSASK